MAFASHRPSAPLLALLVLLGAGCQTTTNLVTGERARGAYTWPQEVQIGAQADPQIIAQFGILDDQGVSAYVDRVARAVLETSAYTDEATPAEIRATPFYFRVLDSPVVNAFALPGGYIYVTRGLLAHLDNEAQLAVVLGHEIGHVLARHASRQAASAQLGQIGLIGAAILGDAVIGRGAGQTILDVGGTGAQLLFLRYGRDAEREADQAGVAYASFAGYDAAQAADFFGTLQRLSGASEGGGSLPSFLSTHPDPAERQRTIPQLAAQYESARDVERTAYLRAIDGIILGENPREGFTEGGVFYHPDLRFQLAYPQGWRVANERQSVTFADPNRQAVMQLTLAPQPSAQAAAQALASQQGVTVTDRQNVTVNGSPAVALAGRAASQQGAIGFLAYLVEYRGSVYQLIGYSGAQTFAQNQRALDAAMRSFAPLTDAARLARQPVRLAAVPAPRTGTFASLLSGRPSVPGLTAEGLAILNQVELNQTVQAGTLIKLPQD